MSNEYMATSNSQSITVHGKKHQCHLKMRKLTHTSVNGMSEVWTISHHKS